jgi:hypothetical protein
MKGRREQQWAFLVLLAITESTYRRRRFGESYRQHRRPLCCYNRRVPREEKLKLPSIFVYDLPSKFNRDLSRQYKRCSTDQYGTEVFFHEALLQVPTPTSSDL